MAASGSTATGVGVEARAALAFEASSYSSSKGFGCSGFDFIIILPDLSFRFS